MSKVITISREFGSGGQTIGHMVAEKLGIPYYDKTIVNQVAENLGFKAEYVEEMGEYADSRASLLLYNSHYSAPFEDPRDKIFRVQTEIIMSAASEGPCVILGRCADYLLKKEKIDALNVFIHAPWSAREKYVVDDGLCTPEEARKFLKKRDKQRRTYYKYYTSQEWGDYKEYHLCLDSAFLGYEKCADYIANAVL